MQQFPDLRVTVIGTGPLLADMLELRRELGLDDTVEFAGAATSSEVKRAMNAARAVVLACRVDESGDRDGMPTVLVEALAQGRPGDLHRRSRHRRAGPRPHHRAAGARRRRAALAAAMGSYWPTRSWPVGSAGRSGPGRLRLHPADATRRLLEVFARDRNILDRPDDDIVVAARPADAAAGSWPRWAVTR